MVSAAYARRSVVRACHVMVVLVAQLDLISAQHVGPCDGGGDTQCAGIPGARRSLNADLARTAQLRRFRRHFDGLLDRAVEAQRAHLVAPCDHTRSHRSVQTTAVVFFHVSFVAKPPLTTVFSALSESTVMRGTATLVRGARTLPAGGPPPVRRRCTRLLAHSPHIAIVSAYRSSHPPVRSMRWCSNTTGLRVPTASNLGALPCAI